MWNPHCGVDAGRCLRGGDDCMREGDGPFRQIRECDAGDANRGYSDENREEIHALTITTATRANNSVLEEMEIGSTDNRS